MERPFDLLQKLADVVVIEAGTLSHIARLDPEGRLLFFLGILNRAFPCKEIQHFFEALARTAHFRLHLGGDIGIEGDGGTHGGIIRLKLHDVKIIAS